MSQSYDSRAASSSSSDSSDAAADLASGTTHAEYVASVAGVRAPSELGALVAVLAAQGRAIDQASAPLMCEQARLLELGGVYVCGRAVGRYAEAGSVSLKADLVRVGDEAGDIVKSVLGK